VKIDDATHAATDIPNEASQLEMLFIALTSSNLELF
jgi:hypothetical protein